MKIRSRELILFGMFGGLTAAMQMALSFIPNVEVVTLLIILFSLIYKKKTLYIVCTFVILMGLLHGFGLWWLGYVILWPLLSLLTPSSMALFKIDSSLLTSILMAWNVLFAG